ncbi:MAG: ring-cleaving dioxygenase [Chloroflexi bacterium]|nr:MAG: ring-cleaving dioxygenase [Chloroflexota bacterium]
MGPLDGCIKGLHHVSVGVDGAQDDIDFCRQVLGLRLIKSTVLFDGRRPVYHFYYADRVGTAGTVFTTFPWRKIGLQGRRGSGQIKRTVFSAPPDSIDFWHARLKNAGAASNGLGERFGQPTVEFQHPSGLDLEIIEAKDDRQPWLGDGVDDGELALRGLHSVTISVIDLQTMKEFLTLLGFQQTAEDGKYSRFEIDGGGPGKRVDLLHEPDLPPGTWTHAIGIPHHFALYCPTEEQQYQIKDHLVGDGYVDFSELKDRFYFRSIYVRSPSGVLVEIASPTAWMRDESEHQLGMTLQMPTWWESRREEFVDNLEPVHLTPPGA